MAASGDLLRFTCSEHEAVKIIEMACQAAGDNEMAERREAVRSTYRKARAGKRITGMGAGTPMTAFEATEWEADLRRLPKDKRRAEAVRRVQAALARLPVDAAGVKKCSSRSLAEMTGVSKNTVNQVLVDLAKKEVLKRVGYGVVMSLEPK